MSADYFDRLYDEKSDPWNFETSDYEARKYDATLSALPRTYYSNGLEIGCSIGVLTEKLSAFCASLVAIDPVEKALGTAAARCANLSVVFAQMSVPGDWPAGQYDLIVLSEVVYYLTLDEVSALARRIQSSLEYKGDVLLVHWTEPTDYPLSGDDAAEAFIKASAAFLRPAYQHRAHSYRIDVLRRF